MRRRLLLSWPAWPLLAHASSAEPGLSFPHDFGSHPTFGLEWWYLTGVLGSPGQPARFGYQLTVFRVKGPAEPAHPSALAARQLLLGHVALSDIAAGRQRHAQRLMRSLPGAAEAAEGDCRVTLRDWHLSRQADGSYRAGFDTHQGVALSLSLTTPEPPLLQGDQGLSRKGPSPEQFSHYYSRPQLLTSARLDLAGQRLDLNGRSWLDHEWSNQLLGPAQDAQSRAVGWDWLGINLHDGSALTLFQLRRADGTRLWAGGSMRTAAGAVRNFAPEDVRMQAVRHWQSQASQSRYPVEWLLDCPTGHFQLRALFDTQEIDARRTSGLLYWEGVARLSDSAGRELGLGYLELTGYAGGLQLG